MKNDDKKEIVQEDDLFLTILNLENTVYMKRTQKTKNSHKQNMNLIKLPKRIKRNITIFKNLKNHFENIKSNRKNMTKSMIHLKYKDLKHHHLPSIFRLLKKGKKINGKMNSLNSKMIKNTKI